MKEKTGSCCCSGEKSQQLKPGTIAGHWIIGEKDIPAGKVPLVQGNLSFKDFLGNLMVRCSINRSKYRVSPGLYASGNPDETSIVLVTANYKLTFDTLRKECRTLDCWILVLDTKGINVWCAAGKGTFGTDELIRQIKATGLASIVTHKGLILPQLGASGVAAHEIKKATGFSVIYGPVRAKDIPEFLKNNMNTNKKMRQVTFSFSDRIILTPVELAGTLKYCALAFIFFIVFAWIKTGSASFSDTLFSAFLSFLPFFGAVLTGTILVPLFLTLIPGKAFAWKGWVGGIIWTLIYLFLIRSEFTWTDIVSYGLLLPALSAFLTMNFTGATSYTSLSGVIFEMKYALPLILISLGSGLVFSIIINIIRFIS